MIHFLRRFKQYSDWIKQEPLVMWISGLHIPQSYLTALVQFTCRKKKWALDKSTLYTIVTNYPSADQIKKRPEDGCYISGLFIEGAAWDLERQCLKRQNPKELIQDMPIIHIVPVESNKLKLKDCLEVPVYVTQLRKNAMGVGLVFMSNLKTNEHPSHWILQGVCLTLNVDY